MAATNQRAEWLVPAGLIALAFIPVAAGASRLAMLAGGGPITPANARFFGAPAAVVLHIVSVTIYSLLGAFQFAPGWRRRAPGWHRAAGGLVLLAGLGAAISGLWMALTYAIVPADSPLLHGLRLFFGAAMVGSIVMGTRAILRRDVARHQAWMRRAYAIGLGAGTQALTQLPLLLLFGAPDASTLAGLMGAAWVLNVAVAEWLNHRARAAAASRAGPTPVGDRPTVEASLRTPHTGRMRRASR